MLEHGERGLERLIDNAHAEKNKTATEKWEYVRDQLSKRRICDFLESFLAKMSVAINKGSSPSLTTAVIDALPYGPQAETKEDRASREAKAKLTEALEDDDDF